MAEERDRWCGDCAFSRFFSGQAGSASDGSPPDPSFYYCFLRKERIEEAEALSDCPQWTASPIWEWAAGE